MSAMDNREEIALKVNDLLKPFLQEFHLVLVDLVVKRRQQDYYLAVIIDRPTGGITIEECSRVNKRLSERLEAENTIREDYILEVSSPGLDRPLKTQQDFLRVMNRTAHFCLAAPVHNKLEQEGLVIKADAAHVVIIVSNYGEVTIPLNTIHKAVQVIKG